MKVLKINHKNSNRKENEKTDARQIQEIKVEHKPVAAAISLWHIAMMIVSGCFAVVGLAALLVPELRACLWEIFLQFAYEVGGTAGVQF